MPCATLPCTWPSTIKGIDDISAVMRDRIFEDRNTARDGIDFDLGDMRSVRHGEA